MDQLVNVLNEDLDPIETREWIDSFKAVIESDGSARAQFLIKQMTDASSRVGAPLPPTVTTPYVNTIPAWAETHSPGDAEMEWRIRSIIRWNAMAMVVRANRRPGKLGGHIASFGSSATLYDVGFNHFWRSASDTFPGDLVMFQGHSSPGVYARSFLEGRLSTQQMDNFRRETTNPRGMALPSYPHPWLMPDYWRVPTVSCGLGPVQAIYQAQFFKYMEARGLMPKTNRKVWCLIGDGESDEPETRGALSVASREHLDNLIFVINCNLQRLDGPVRGDGHIIQELEGLFRGSGWNVLKVIWGSKWDPLLAHDPNGVLRKLMNETVDGDFQAFKANGGGYMREHFFDKYAETAALVAKLSDEDIGKLNRGGHDPAKIYAAYDKAVHTEGVPTVILAHTVKGYGMGSAGESMNIAHQAKKMHHDAVIAMRDRFKIPLTDKQLEGEDVDSVPYYHPGKNSPEVKYMMERRAALGGVLPQRRRKATKTFKAPDLDAFKSMTNGTGEREISNTMALVRGMNLLIRDKQLGQRIVPIVVDEARTFGMEGMFRQIGIYAPGGQKYTPQDADQLAFYREAADGQVLQLGMTEAGGVSSWIAAGTSYSVSDQPMLPFYLYYAFFGFRRVGDLIWAAGDQRTRGFLVGATAGCSFPGEGLQHSDCASPLMAGTIPDCRSYDPCFSYEVAVIMQAGVKEMFEEQKDVFYYVTVGNDNYTHPDMPEGCYDGILKGMYLYQDAGKASAKTPRVQLLASGPTLREAIHAAQVLEADYGVKADVWSCPSYGELSRDGFDCERYNRLHTGTDKPRVPYVEQCLTDHAGPVIAASEYVRAVADQVRAFVPAGRAFTALGADGFGRSDTREALRNFFEVDYRWIAHAALVALAGEGKIDAKVPAKALKDFALDADKPNPLTV